MAKYRLCYKSYKDGYQAINLKGFENILGDKVTKIEAIDTLTAMFNNEEDLLNFLKVRELIGKDVTKLYITKDKIDDNNNVTNEKIYNGENLFFKRDEFLLDMTFIKKWFKKNENNYEIMLDVIRYYKNEYKSNFDNSSTFKKLCDLETIVINRANGYILDQTESYEVYNQNIEYFIKHEFYKINDDFSIKLDDNGNKKIKYRNIRDFAILIKLIDRNLEYPVIKEICQDLKKEVDESDEFMTSEDYKKMKEELINNFYKEDVTKEVYEESLDEYAIKHTLK